MIPKHLSSFAISQRAVPLLAALSSVEYPNCGISAGGFAFRIEVSDLLFNSKLLHHFPYQ